MSRRWAILVSAVLIIAGVVIVIVLNTGDDDNVVTLAVADLSEHLGISGEPTHQRVSRWERSFPQYRPGHNERVASIADALRRDADGVVATGAAFAGLGIPACIRQGREAARAMLARAVAR